MLDRAAQEKIVGDLLEGRLVLLDGDVGPVAKAFLLEGLVKRLEEPKQQERFAKSETLRWTLTQFVIRELPVALQASFLLRIVTITRNVPSAVSGWLTLPNVRDWIKTYQVHLLY